MPEWLKGADCKSAVLCYVGSNPTRPNYMTNLSDIIKNLFIENFLDFFSVLWVVHNHF